MAKLLLLPRYTEKAHQARSTIRRKVAQLINRHGLVRLMIASLSVFALLGIITDLVHVHLRDRHIGAKPFFLLSKPVVTISQGAYEGTAMRGDFPVAVEMFLGVPYAQDTAGEARFKAPVRRPASEEKFLATSYGFRCPSSGGKDVPEGEDCLNLNIYRPQERPVNQPLPVAVYFHGGAFNFGSGRSRALSSMVGWSTEPFIGVSFNYRLGALGFLPSTMMKEEDALNIGLKDQLMALQWVKENIAAFGGNPDEITAMGASAGAHSIGHHMLRNFTDHGLPQLFHKAILESGAPTARAVYPFNHKLHEDQFKEFLELAGAGALQDRGEIMKHLRALPVKQIKKASEDVYNKYHPSMRWAFQPVIDGPGGMIEVAPYERWLKGDWNSMPILTGFNTEEGTVFVPKDMDTPEEFTEFFHTLLPQFNTTDLAELNKLYPDPGDDKEAVYYNKQPGTGRQFRRVAAAYGHFAYIAPVRMTAKLAHYKTNLNQRPIHYYEFDVKQSQIYGAQHGAEEEYVTYSPAVVNGPFHTKEISGEVHAYWTSYIVTGVEDPSTDRIRVENHWGGRRNWGQYGQKGSSNKMLIGMGNDQRAGGNNIGYPSQQAADKVAIKESNFWWSRVALFES